MNRINKFFLIIALFSMPYVYAMEYNPSQEQLLAENKIKSQRVVEIDHLSEAPRDILERIYCYVVSLNDDEDMNALFRNRRNFRLISKKYNGISYTKLANMAFVNSVLKLESISTKAHAEVEQKRKEIWQNYRQDNSTKKNLLKELDDLEPLYEAAEITKVKAKKN